MMTNTKETFKVHRKDKPFTMVDNNLIDNKSISWQAKGVLIYLFSKPESWKIYKQDIVNHATNGKASLNTIMSELRKTGYMTLAKVIRNGKIVEWRYSIYEEPLLEPVPEQLTIVLDDNSDEPDHTLENNNKKPETENQIVENSDSLIPETEKRILDNSTHTKPESDLPLVGIPPLENRPYSNTKKSNTQSNQKRLSKNGYKKAVKHSIDFDSWGKSAQKLDIRDLEIIISYMADLCFSERKQIKINKNLHDTDIIRNEFLNISQREILEVLANYQAQRNISKPKPYIWTCVYNQLQQPDPQDSYAQNRDNAKNYDGSHEPPSYDLAELEQRGMFVPEL